MATQAPPQAPATTTTTAPTAADDRVVERGGLQASLTATPAGFAEDESLSLFDAAHADAAPSRRELLERAASLGPARPTFASMFFEPADPVLGAKMLPQVAARRARFRKLVKGALGSCVACCIIATVASAFSATASTTPGVSSRRTRATVDVPVERLEVATRTKAPGHIIAAARPVPRSAKRR